MIWIFMSSLAWPISVPTSQAISPASLYGLYRGTGSAGQPVTIFYSGGTPQVMVKTACPRF